MAIFTKPCGRPGCPHPIVQPSQKKLDRAKFHSSSCAIHTRMAAGWRPHAYLTPECRSRGARKAGKVTGRQRHRASLLRAARKVERFLPPEFQEELSAQQLARFRVILAKAVIWAYASGARKTDSNRRYWKKKATAAA